MSSLIPAASIIFGGCCGSVISFETMIQFDKGLSNLITFSQFVFITLMNLPLFLTFSNGRLRLKDLHVPIKVYFISVILFYLGTVGNNIIFQYHISIPIHITFRCFSTVLTMIISYLLLGKRYSSLQMTSTFFLTVGAIIASLYRDHEFNLVDFLKAFNGNLTVLPPTSTSTSEITSTSSAILPSLSALNLSTPITTSDPALLSKVLNFNPSSFDIVFIEGIIILIGSSILSSLLSCYNEWTYKKYGKYWQENLFYSHLLSIPLFFTNIFGLKEQLVEVVKYPVGYQMQQIYISNQLIAFFMNLVSQYFCITGVNMLASKTDATTLSIVLLVRKFVSLILSVFIFKNKMSYTSYFGIVLVFFGAFLYIWGSGQKPKENKKEKN